jgi:hypothetical protein
MVDPRLGSCLVRLASMAGSDDYTLKVSYWSLASRIIKVVALPNKEECAERHAMVPCVAKLAGVVDFLGNPRNGNIRAMDACMAC